ncbi:hypothetical protein ACJX0J_007561, partial [Zea mays]
GVLYCRPHFDQLLKRTGSLDKSFQAAEKSFVAAPKIVKNTAASAADFLLICNGCNKPV